MKKGLLIVAMMVAVSASAQENFTSKKGTPILPESGDWSIGIGASSTMGYFGNLLNGNTDNSNPSFDFTNSNKVITGKMMKDANTAYRLALRLGIGSNKTTGSDTSAGAVKDTKISSNNINIGGGIQKYRGKGRVKGIYGAEASIGLSGGKTTYTYNGTANAGDVLESKNGSSFNFGVRGFIGVEYFFAPKMSLGGEFGWGLGISSSGASETTIANGIGGSSSSKGGKGSSFGFDTDNAGAQINLNFYF